jgi:NAD(P)-dependent dehydrogenase (short-subunit alcohol dehydrogenase family)
MSQRCAANPPTHSPFAPKSQPRPRPAVRIFAPRVRQAPNDEEKLYFADHAAVKRWAAPRELAGPALLLASEAGSYITGQGIVVDGGAAVNVL